MDACPENIIFMDAISSKVYQRLFFGLVWESSFFHPTFLELHTNVTGPFSQEPGRPLSKALEEASRKKFVKAN